MVFSSHPLLPFAYAEGNSFPFQSVHHAKIFRGNEFPGQGLKFASTGLRTSVCTGPVLWLMCKGYGHLPLKRSKPLEPSRFPL